MLSDSDVAFLHELADTLVASNEGGCIAIIGTPSEETAAAAEAVLQEAIADRIEWHPIVLDRWVPEPMSHVAAYSAGVRRVSVFSVTGWNTLGRAPESLADALRNLDDAYEILASIRVVHWIDAPARALLCDIASETWAASRFRRWIETDADRAANLPSLAESFEHDSEVTPSGPPDSVAPLLAVVDIARRGAPEDLAAALLAAAGAWREAGAPLEAKPLYEEALPYLAALDDGRGRAVCMRGIAEALVVGGDDVAGAQYLEEARSAFSGYGDVAAAAEIIPELAAAWERLGDPAHASALYEEAAGAFELMGDSARAEECRREWERLTNR